MATRLDYYSGIGTEIPKGDIRISASSVSKFLYKTSEWYQETILGNKNFISSTATVLGTCVHFCAEEYVKSGTVDAKEIEKYIDQEYKRNPEIDIEVIRTQYPIMGEALVNEYVQVNQDITAEKYTAYEASKGIWLSGSIDAIHNGIVVDYKTTSALSAPTSIKLDHRYQLLMYCWLLRQEGITIDRIRIVYITTNEVGRVGKPTKTNPNGGKLKDYPTTVTTITEVIGDQDYEFIDNIMNLIVDTVVKGIENPELKYLLYKDYRLK